MGECIDVEESSSIFFSYLAANANGIWVMVGIVLALILGVQWLAWIFRKGRFATDNRPYDPSIRQVRHIFADLAVNIINDFRHLLAGGIVLLFGLVLAYSLTRSNDVKEISSVLQAVASSLGGLIGAILGYYFGESAGKRQSPSSPVVTTGEAEQRDDIPAPRGFREANILRPPSDEGRPDG